MSAYQYDEVFRAAQAYMRECENPVSDYMHRRHLREHLFATVKAASRAAAPRGEDGKKSEPL